MEKAAKIYIAGHDGLVGSAFVRKLKEQGYENLIFAHYTEVDLRRQEDTERFFEKHKPEYVFLAAAKVGGILANNTYKAEFIYDNLMIATNVIHSSYKFGVKKLLNLGSSCIYPKLAPQPLKEEYLLTGPLEPTNEPYAIAKIAAIKLCRYYNEQYGTNFISVMPTNMYGPHDNFNLETSHVLPAMLRKFQLAKLLSEEKYDAVISDLKKYGNFPADLSTALSNHHSLTTSHLSRFGIYPDHVSLWGSGTPYREFLHVDDMVDACLMLMEKFSCQEIGELINIGTGEDTTIKDLAELIRGIVGFNGEIRWDSSKPDGTPKKQQDVSRLNGLKWKAKIDIKEGIKKYYQWYLNNCIGK
ncbi:MAG: GDP-L-fucose synthase [Candidatus Wallbacteria bacterium]|nr:GDP-L-fucose synthase [Candidatus Wallbacteria bacterium]